MGARLGLHQVTVNDLSPVALVEMAHKVGCEEVIVFTHIPQAASPAADTPAFPLIRRADAPDMKRVLNDTGVTIGNAEFFPIFKDLPIDAYREGFEVAAAIGAKRIVTHIHDRNESRALENLGRLCDLGGDYGLDVAVEFMGLSAGCTSLERALWFAKEVGRDNVGVGIDALHLIRTGGTPEQVRAADAHYIAYAQICDGASLDVSGDYLPEAFERMLPGAGVFPLAAFVAALPDTAAIDVEIPSEKRIAAGLPALEHARTAVHLSRKLLENLSADR